MTFRRLLLGVLVVVVAVAAFSSEARRTLENWYVGAPFALAVNAMRLRLSPGNDDGCLDRLTASGRPFRKIPDTDFPPDCPVVHAVALEWPVRSLRFMTCGLATAVHAYWADGLERLANDILGEPIVRVGDLGVRNCRLMTGHRFLRSEHAFANAIDFAEFELASGDVVRVADAWNGDDRRAWFVHEAAKRACDFFSMVVTPDHDPDHRDHIHADVGIFSGCELDDDRLARLRALGGR